MRITLTCIYFKNFLSLYFTKSTYSLISYCFSMFYANEKEIKEVEISYSLLIISLTRKVSHFYLLQLSILVKDFEKERTSWEKNTTVLNSEKKSLEEQLSHIKKEKSNLENQLSVQSQVSFSQIFI